MNPWWNDFMKRMNLEHDERCEGGRGCPVRDEHVSRVYVPQALRDVIDRHPRAQVEAVTGRPS